MSEGEYNGDRWTEARSLGHADKVTDLVTTEVDGRQVVVTASDATLRIWDPATGELVGEPLTGHDSPVTAVAAIALDERPHAVTISRNGTARLWDLAAGRQVGPPMRRYPSVDMSAMSPAELTRVLMSGTSLHAVMTVATAKIGDSGVAVLGGSDGAQVWDLATGEARGEPLTEDPVFAATTAELDGRPIAATNGIGPVHLWDLGTGAAIGELPGEIQTDGPVTGLATGEVDGRTVILTTRIRLKSERRIKTQIWDPVTCAPICEPIQSQGSDLALGPMAVTVLDGRPCVVAGGGVPPGRGVLLAWDLNTHERLGEAQAFPSLPGKVTPYPDGPEGSLLISFGTEVAVLTPR